MTNQRHLMQSVVDLSPHKTLNPVWYLVMVKNEHAQGCYSDFNLLDKGKKKAQNEAA